MILGDVTETHTVIEIDEETFEEIVKARTPHPTEVSHNFLASEA